MNIESQYLVKDPAATGFLDNAQLDTGLAAMLGDPKGIDAHVAPDVQSAHITLKDAAKKIAALVGDPTRTEVQKHAAAKQLAHLGRLSEARAAAGSAVRWRFTCLRAWRWRLRLALAP